MDESYQSNLNENKRKSKIFSPSWYPGTSKVVLTFRGKSSQRPSPLRTEWAKVNRKGRVSVCRGTTLGRVWSLGHGQVETGWAEWKVPVESHNPSSWSLESLWVAGGALSGLPGEGPGEKDPEVGWTSIVVTREEAQSRAGISPNAAPAEQTVP